jgi:SAM-dependent methyltransferase
MNTLIDAQITSTRTLAGTSEGTGDRAHDWRDAGAAWGHAAADWSTLFETYSCAALLEVVRWLGLAPGVALLDIACGSGWPTMQAAGTGAEVAGIDASHELIEIARLRNPQADLRVGSMFELPWPDESFDAAMSINGIWGGCERAVVEAARVLRPGGVLAITFWGAGPPLDLRSCFKVFAHHSPPEHVGSMRRLNDISQPGVAEVMIEAAGLVCSGRHRRISTVEWPDDEIAWRALSSTGPALPALAHGGRRAVRRDVLAAVAPCRDQRGTYRFRNDHHIVIARKPGPPETDTGD